MTLPWQADAYYGFTAARIEPIVPSLPCLRGGEWSSAGLVLREGEAPRCTAHDRAIAEVVLWLGYSMLRGRSEWVEPVGVQPWFVHLEGTSDVASVVRDGRKCYDTCAMGMPR